MSQHFRCGAAALLVALSPGAAHAQGISDVPQILVTGSRLPQPADTAPLATLSVPHDALLPAGRISIGDILNDLPQLRTTLGSQNSTAGVGVKGLNLLDLRGLGTPRTLVLVNGRRHVGSEILNDRSGVDINSFPTDLIERIDITTGGGTTAYGSDAVAGVVNFVLKDHFEGVTLRAQTGVSQYRDAGNQRLSILAGQNLGGGRGNIAINAEYAHQSRYFGEKRPTLGQNNGFVVVDTDPPGAVNGSDGVPDRRFFRDIRASTLSFGGQVGIRTGSSAPCGRDGTGAAYSCAYLFQPGGALVPQTGTRIGLAPNGNFVGGNGFSAREGDLLILSPEFDRYAVNLIGHFAVTRGFVPFVEAKFARIRSSGSQNGPFLSLGQSLGDSLTVAGFNDRSFLPSGAVNREGLRLDNPYLLPSARTVLTDQLRASISAGINPNTGLPLTPANRTAALAQLADGSFRFSSRRNFLEFGIRDEVITRDTYRIVAGARGDIGGAWHYEVALNYGEHDEHNRITGNVNRQRFLLAIDSVPGPNGTIICRAKIDPAYAGTDRTGNAATLAADIAACVPINPFGAGSVSQAAKDYVLTDSYADGRASQLVASAFLSGDTAGAFTLPAGPLRFALGAEHRRETLRYQLDPLAQAGYTFYTAVPAFAAPAFMVSEAFGEVALPLAANAPLMQTLTLTGSGRVARYRGNAGTVFAYGSDLTWRFSPDLQLRASVSQSVRAPYLGELFAPSTQNFAISPSDPCAARNIGTASGNRARNCAAAGRPDGYDFAYTIPLEIRSGGNPKLQAERSRSLIVGAAITPRRIPGLSLDIGYYDIAISNAIAAVSAQQILNLCYDLPTLANPYCGLFNRAGSAGGPRGEQPFRVLEASLLQSSTNFARRTARGIDVNARYARQLGRARLSLEGIYTHVLARDAFSDPTNPAIRDVVTGELGDPKDAFNLSAQMHLGAVTLGYKLRYLSAMYLNAYEDYNALNGQPAQNTDYAEIARYPAVAYHDVTMGLRVNQQFSLLAGVTNVGNTFPPYGLTGVSAGSAIYDNRGRFFFLGVTASL